MADSPLLDSSGVIALTIKSNGQTISDAIQIVSVEVNYCVNKIPSAKIVILDGDMPNTDFPVSNLDDFKPGAEIQVEAGYGSEKTNLFSGIVVRHSIRISRENFSHLIVFCKDKAIAMTVGRKNANFINAKDSDVINKLMSGYSDLYSDVADSKTVLKEVVQYYCTDWDFLLARTEINGYLVTVDAGKVSVKAPQVDGAAELTVTYGTDLLAFDADLDAYAQFSVVKGVTWDPSTQTVTEAQNGPVALNRQGNVNSAELAQVIGLDNFILQSNIPLDNAVLTNWVKGQQVKSSLAKIKGSATFQGNAKAKIGALIELKGVGNRFNGNVLVTEARHKIADGNWITEIQFGLSEKWFVEQHDIQAPLASGLTPGIRGLQIGVVKKLDADPEGQFKIQVSIPVMQAETEGVWARLASFYGSSDFGAFFIPEIGDEVVLGYFNNDPSYPVILGSLYSSKRKPAYELTSENNTKAVVTRSKLKIEFDEEKKVITLLTPNDNKIVISDEQKSILLQDENNNKVELNAGGITLDSPKDIKINAKGKVAIDAVGNIELASQADIANNALNIKQEAKIGVVAKGGASAELSASGQTTIKGAMVLIN